MPLSKVQIEVLSVLASHRDPESYVAGATPLNRDGPRYSADIDVFHDREERVAAAAMADAAILTAEGFAVRWLRQLPLAYAAELTSTEGKTRLEWVTDSDFRFFPVVPDQMFGYMLHPADLATNKVMAAVGRREVRDLVDLITVDHSILSLGAVVWAAAEKSPGFTPEALIAEIRRNSHYPASEWRALATAEPLDPAVVTAELRSALDKAEAFVIRMPTEKAGLLFLEDGKMVEPDPSRLSRYETHAGRRRGHWPASVDIEGAMLDLYTKRQRDV